MSINMAGITMCSGGDCPNKDTCYRHTAPEGMRQSWFVSVPVDCFDNCEYYWKTKEKSTNEDN